MAQEGLGGVSGRPGVEPTGWGIMVNSAVDDACLQAAIAVPKCNRAGLRHVACSNQSSCTS
jgi:hypothetical protein